MNERVPQFTLYFEPKTNLFVCLPHQRSSETGFYTDRSFYVIMNKEGVLKLLATLASRDTMIDDDFANCGLEKLCPVDYTRIQRLPRIAAESATNENLWLLPMRRFGKGFASNPGEHVAIRRSVAVKSIESALKKAFSLLGVRF